MNFNSYRVLADERVASIRDVQKNPSKALQGVTRVMCGGKTIGFFFENEELNELIEDLEMTASKDLRAKAAAIRNGRTSGVRLDILAKRYGL